MQLNAKNIKNPCQLHPPPAAHLARLALHALDDRVPLGQGLERVQRLHARGQRARALKREVYHVLHQNLEVLDGALERIEVVVPPRDLDVQDVVVQAPQRGDQLLEGGLWIGSRTGFGSQGLRSAVGLSKLSRQILARRELEAEKP